MSREYLGDYRLKHRVVYESGLDSACIYCGNNADSREHVPSKVFLSKPYPDDLFIVPSCKKCNSSFSNDELYTWFVIKILQHEYSDCGSLQDNEITRFKRYEKMARTVSSEIKKYCEGDSEPICDYHIKGKKAWSFRNDRIDRVLEKLAIGHAVFELSEGYRDSQGSRWATKDIAYTYAPAMSTQEIECYDDIVIMNNRLLPEIGSRVFEKIYVVNEDLIDSSGGNARLSAVFLDWTDVQDGKYRYIAEHFKDEITVRIVVDEYMFACVSFQRV